MPPRLAPIIAPVLSVSLAIVLLSPTAAAAHGGGLDAHGCHHGWKRGGYHCHRGPFAGRSFSSQAEMLEEKAAGSEKLVKPERAPRPKPDPATIR